MRLPALPGGLAFAASYALHIIGRGFGRQYGLKRLAVFVRGRQKQLVRYADLLKQLAAARALWS